MARYLLDTQVLLWFLSGSDRLPTTWREAIEVGANAVYFSAASIWEIAIKAKLARQDFGYRPAEIAAEAKAIDFQELPITSEVAAGILDLPPIHRDPFDRLLIAQAQAAQLTLLTSDRTIARYGGSVELV